MRSTYLFVATFISFAFALYCQNGYSQECSRDALTAKYWQYRDNLENHFMMIDREPEGCIGNGITAVDSNSSQPITCATKLLHGYSLPATSIIQTPDGGWGMGDRNDANNEDFFNPNCANNLDPTISGTSHPGNPAGNHKHNYLELNSETPHQLGWYLITLASEYALLQSNGQLEQAQRTLEEIFLALQAYRRLDITANCLVKARYDEITANFEVDSCIIGIGVHHEVGACLCGPKYKIAQCPNDNDLGTQNNYFDIPCKDNCPWEPDLSGYSGFYIREDATQSLEALHDPSEDKWNIDLVSSSYAMSQSPPCDPTSSQTCYMWHGGDFLSADQMYAIMMGLAMVKRFVPAGATVTTCNGELYHPLEIAQKIAKGFVKLPKNSTRHIFWPGSSDENCCFKPVKFGACAGGNFQVLYAGLQYMYNYINPEDKHSICILDYAKWWGITASSSLPPIGNNGNGNFVLEAMAVGRDWTTLGPAQFTELVEGSFARNREVFLLMNDVLHPGGAKISAVAKSMFQQMLCSAPCGGPCRKPLAYEPHDATWPNFECANTPGWTGQRWEGPREVSWDPNDNYLGRQFNGLDYMALYNLYMLTFPEEQTPFYDPESPNYSGDHFLGESAIEGPTTLCPGERGTYTVINSNIPSTIESLLWTSSPHFTFTSVTDNPTMATYEFPSAPGYAHISASFDENRDIQQYNPVQTIGTVSTLGEIGYVYPLEPTDGVTVSDVCHLSYIKPISSATIPYTITTDLDHCSSSYWFHAIGPDALYYSWHIIADPADPNLANMEVWGTGQNFNYEHPHFPGASGQLAIDLFVTNDCGEFEATSSVPYSCPNAGLNVRANPNPAQNNIYISIIRNDQTPYYITNPNGIQIRITPANGGVQSVTSQMYSNGQNISIGALPNGVYRIFATASDITPLSSTLVIMR